MGSKYNGTKEELRALDAYIALSRAARSVEPEIGRHLLSEFGLTERQFAVLEVLYHLGALNQRQIAKKILCTPGNLTGLLRNLEGKQLISRCEDRHDSRNLTVSLSQKGTELVSAILPAHIRGIVKRFAVLSASEQETLKELCKKLGQTPPQP